MLRKNLLLRVFAILSLILGNFALLPIAHGTPKLTISESQPIKVLNGATTLTINLPSDFVPTSVNFDWQYRIIKITNLDGSATNSVFDSIRKFDWQDGIPNPVENLSIYERDYFQKPDEGMINLKITPKGRKATAVASSLIQAKIVFEISVTNEEGNANETAKGTLIVDFFKSSDPSAIVAPLPKPDQLFIEVNNPNPGSSKKTKVSISVAENSPKIMSGNGVSYSRSYFVQRVTPNGIPIGNIKKFDNWFQVELTEDNYYAAGLVFRVYSTQIIPEFSYFRSNNLTKEICGSCYENSTTIFTLMYQDFPIKVNFDKQPPSLTERNSKNSSLLQTELSNYMRDTFRWSDDPEVNLVLANSSPKSIVNDIGYKGASEIYYKFQVDVTKFPSEATCLRTGLDIQFFENNKWTSVFSKKDYYTGNTIYGKPSEVFFLNCLDINLNKNDYYYNEKSENYINRSLRGAPLPVLNLGKRNFRLILVNQFEMIDGTLGEVFEINAANFEVNYVKSSPPPTLKVYVSYPSNVLIGQKYLAIATTNPLKNGTCYYYLFNRVRIPVGSSSLKNGKSSLRITAFSSIPNSGRPNSLTVVCNSGNVSGTGGAYFYAYTQ